MAAVSGVMSKHQEIGVAQAGIRSLVSRIYLVTVMSLFRTCFDPKYPYNCGYDTAAVCYFLKRYFQVMRARNARATIPGISYERNCT